MFNQLLVKYGHILGLFDILPIFSLFFFHKWSMLISNKNSIYELPNKLLKNLTLRILGN